MHTYLHTYARSLTTFYLIPCDAAENPRIWYKKQFYPPINHLVNNTATIENKGKINNNDYIASMIIE